MLTHTQSNIRHNGFAVNPTYSGIYAHAVEVPANARQLWLSGQIGVPPDGAVAPDFKSQFQQAMQNIKTNLNVASMGLQDIVQMRFYLTHRQHMSELVELRKALLDGLSPAVTTYFVAGLVEENWLIEVDVLACQLPSQSDSRFARLL